MVVDDSGEMQIRQYWDVNLARSEGVQRKRMVDYVEELNATLHDVVEKEMISDVPIGVLLSGGIDSSAIAAIMSDPPRKS